MKEEKIYWVALFDSVSYVIKAERILKKAEIPHKIIPVPKSISTDCGVCVRFASDQKNAVMDALGSSIQDIEICELL